MHEDIHFLQTTMWELLVPLQANTPAQWGIMNAQQMVEHLKLPFIIALGEGEFSPLFDEVTTQKKYYHVITKKRPFPRNIKFENGILAEPLPLEYTSIPEAIEGLRLVVNEFLSKFQSQPDLITLHPVLGKLNFQDWAYFQHQHVAHHFIQFGLLPDTTEPINTP